jgi:hypothetical protein
MNLVKEANDLVKFGAGVADDGPVLHVRFLMAIGLILIHRVGLVQLRPALLPDNVHRLFSIHKRYVMLLRLHWRLIIINFAFAFTLSLLSAQYFS